MQKRFHDNKDVFNGAKNFREILEQVLEEKKKKMTDTDYKASGWPYYRANMDGYNKALQDVVEMMKD